MEQENEITLLYVDLFCGAGGTTSGVEYARVGGRKCAEVVACVNHDAHAIASHEANHPNVLHFTEDIRTLDFTKPYHLKGRTYVSLLQHVANKRKEYPKAKLALWASLECTNFSKAKGGRPRDADSRTLAEHLFRYIEALHPDYILIENVEEFMCWGELDEHGKPLSKNKGSDYTKWVKNVCKYGYDFDWRILNAADFGAYTSRKRFFGQFARKGLPIVFPYQTYAKTTLPLANKSYYGSVYRPNPDWSDLFDGFYKPWKAVRDVLDLNDEGESIFTRKKPLCENTLERIYAGLVKFIAGGKKKHQEFMVRYNGVRAKDTVKTLDEPCGVVTTENRFAKVKCQFLSKQFGGDPSGKSVDIDQPAGTITCRDHHAFVTAQYLMNPYSFKSDGGSIDKPCFTLIARMDKMPPYLITTKDGVTGIAIYDDDSPWTCKIKEFMAAYGIFDICMRMLNISELKRIMGFPTDYILVGTSAEQKKYIGNAVEVNMSRVLCEALSERLIKVA